LDEELVEVVDAKVNHCLLGRGSKVTRIGREMGKDGHSERIRTVECERTAFLFGNAEVFYIPGSQSFRIAGPQKNASHTNCARHSLVLPPHELIELRFVFGFAPGTRLSIEYTSRLRLANPFAGIGFHGLRGREACSLAFRHRKDEYGIVWS